MAKWPEHYVDKVYAGVLGKLIGVRYGSFDEGWDAHELKWGFEESEFDGYLRNYKNFGPDDDINGSAFFIKSLEDSKLGKKLTPEAVAQAWRDYVPDHHGFFWWGGYGISTEQTAYENLESGIPAPQSGSTAQNGEYVANQIGGQIFSDYWGLIIPNDPSLAAKLAGIAASVSHDQEGIYGGRFVAAAVSAAFSAATIESVIQTGLAQIPADSKYAEVFHVMKAQHDQYPDNWRKSFETIWENYSYAKYGGPHMIPNAAIIALALYYGDGDFTKTIKICNLCGWDTDCNVGNVGTILAVFNGLKGIASQWIRPINDFVCYSSLLGAENISDLPTLAGRIAGLGLELADRKPADASEQIIVDHSSDCHFELPGSTHAFKVDADPAADPKSVRLENTTDEANTGQRSLRIMVPTLTMGYPIRVVKQTYYDSHDFDNSQYDPGFSPTIYPGAKLQVRLKRRPGEESPVQARLFAYDQQNNKYYYGKKSWVIDTWTTLSFVIPALHNATIKTIGLELASRDNDPQLVTCYMDDFQQSVDAAYKQDFDKLKFDQWTQYHREFEQFTTNRGSLYLQDGCLNMSFAGKPAEIFTGLRDWANYRLSVSLKLLNGEDHRLYFRVRGEGNCVFLTLGHHQISLIERINSQEVTRATSQFDEPDPKQLVNVTIEVADRNVSVFINGEEAFHQIKLYAAAGMIGFGNAGNSRTQFQSFSLITSDSHRPETFGEEMISDVD